MGTVRACGPSGGWVLLKASQGACPVRSGPVRSGPCPLTGGCITCMRACTYVRGVGVGGRVPGPYPGLTPRPAFCVVRLPLLSVRHPCPPCAAPPRPRPARLPHAARREMLHELCRRVAFLGEPFELAAAHSVATMQAIVDSKGGRQAVLQEYRRSIGYSVPAAPEKVPYVQGKVPPAPPPPAGLGGAERPSSCVVVGQISLGLVLSMLWLSPAGGGHRGHMSSGWVKEARPLASHSIPHTCRLHAAVLPRPRRMPAVPPQWARQLWLWPGYWCCRSCSPPGGARGAEGGAGDER